MDFVGRAARRPMPRRLDVSDWNVDSDVRSGVSSSVSRNPSSERVAFETRAAALDPSRRLSLASGGELRNPTSTTLRPVNRYDGATSITRDEPSTVTASSWRASDAFTQSTTSVRRMERTQVARAPAPATPERLQPRTMPSTRSEAVSSRAVYTASPSASRPSWDQDTQSSRANSVAARATTEPVRVSLQRESLPSAFFSPVRNQERDEPTTPATVYSDASTHLTSSPYTPSITDTPSSTATSTTPTTPFTPSSYGTSRRHHQHETSPVQYANNNNNSVSLDSESESELADHQIREPTVRSPPLREQETMDATHRTTTPIRTELTPQQQREQLYDFRREMRQVFARVDEMVDMHRDLFKCDPLSGMPQFNDTIAQDTAHFTSETFEQLTALRRRFEELAIPRAETTHENRSGDIPDSTSVSRHATEHIAESREIRERRALEESISIGTNSSMATSEPASSPSSTPTSATSATARPHPQRTTTSERHHTRPRWEPTLSSLSNNSSSSSSSSSSTPSSLSIPPSSQASFPTDLPSTVFRPSADVGSSRMNVFEDFDKRMEEIRASLNSIARDRPRATPTAPAPAPVSPPSPASSSWRPSTANKFHSSSPESCSDQDDPSRENDPHSGNHMRRPTDTSRQDREARLRQLLRELRDTGDNDSASTTSSWE